ncbi:unnamed protein product [Moneuplotes crassus]|uniref:Endoplasmic reticulum vesicle transporter C-terminal domain-containing protein n=1 Tax=Euplotes crassus TaxID=5936 RepID=A0AAD1XL61_EUPCR|nr:unnamed protein product [Moneuplotes crassus]
MIMVSLCMFEIQALFDNNVISVLKIEQMDPHEKIQINIDIDFPATPYDVISLDIQDEMGTHMNELEEGLKWNKSRRLQRYCTESNGLKCEKIEDQLKRAQIAFETGGGCNIIGNISVNRVPGNFHIESYAYMQLLAMLGQQINLTHTIHNLSFGNKRVLKSVQKKFKDKAGEFISLIGHKEISEELGTSTNYQLNLVPTRYRDYFGFKHSFVYQYTYTVGSENIGNEVVYFKYFINGITGDYMQTADTFLQFIIGICTIIGGVFTMFHILSVMLNKSINVLYKERIGKKD